MLVDGLPLIFRIHPIAFLPVPGEKRQPVRYRLSIVIRLSQLRKACQIQNVSRKKSDAVFLRFLLYGGGNIKRQIVLLYFIQFLIRQLHCLGQSVCLV